MMEFIRLRNGVQIPMLGMGVFQIPAEQCVSVVMDALAAGYRLIDTASSYQNEAAVGEAIARSGIPRAQLFITTKAYIHQMGYAQTMAAFETSLQNLGLDHLDHGERWRSCMRKEGCAPSASATFCRIVCLICA